MPSGIDALVCTASTVLRLSAYIFLRWIPGHHFPPIIVASLIGYLTTIAVYVSSFGPSLRESFPKLFRHETLRKRGDVNQPENDHEPIVYQDESAILKILLLGIPNWREWEFSYATIAVNILLAILSLDLVFRAPVLHPSNDVVFSRVGFVDSSSAKVLVREPRATELPLHVYLQGPFDSSWTVADTIYWLSEQTDYTHPVLLSNLVPGTEYRYSLSNSLEGSFTTEPLAGTPESRSLTFLTSSCIKANFPYNPFSHSLAIHGFKYVTKVIQSLPQMPSFMLFLGDFIYVDVPLRLSSSVAHYRSEYRRVYASPSWRLPGLSLPWLHVLDDHEIANDWASGNMTDPFPAASDPFIHYHVAVNPPLSTSASSLAQENITFFEFTRGPASFFMLDTRRYRTEPEPTVADTLSRHSSLSPSSSHSRLQEPPTDHTMLGAVQLQALLEFLGAAPLPGVEFKFIVSSVPFTKNWRIGTSDSWGGFLAERRKILHAMHEAEHQYGVRIVILSGDRHEFAAVRFPPDSPIALSSSSSQGEGPDADAGPHEFSIGPLSMFYLPIRTFKQVDDEDVAISYIPDGNSKIGAITIKPSSSKPGEILKSRATLHFTLFVDGEQTFTYNLTSPAPTFRGSWFDRNELWS